MKFIHLLNTEYPPIDAKKRDAAFDVMKGLLIIFVVVGHTTLLGDYNKIVFWFHVPCFFMISGALQNWGGQIVPFAKKRFFSYAIPYFAWSVLWYFVFIPEPPLKYIARILYGGANNSLFFTYPFWFINALFIGSVLFELLWNLSREKKRRIALFSILSIAYIIIRYALNIIPGWNLPWSLEIVPFVCIYFILGVIIKIILRDCNKVIYWIYFISIFCVFGFITLYIQGKFGYEVNVKANLYGCLWADILIPVIFFFFLRFLSCLLSKTKCIKGALIEIGKSTLTIMFCHAALFNIVLQKGITSNIIIILLAVVIGVLIDSLLRKYKFLSILFLGKNISRKSS